MTEVIKAERSFGRALLLYGAGSTLAIGIAGSVLTAFQKGEAERLAVWVCAIVALLVQMVAFAIARLLSQNGNGIAGWGIGAIICFGVLVLFGFASPALGLPPGTAMLSLATYFFLTELIEPPLLTT